MSPADLQSADALRDKLAVIPYRGYGNSETWKRLGYDEIAKHLIDVVAESNSPIVKASGLLASVPHNDVRRNKQLKEDAFHFDAQADTQDAMARALMEMAVLAHFSRNMEHASALQQFCFNKQERENNRVGRKSSEPPEEKKH